MNRTFVHTDPAVKEAGAAAEASARRGSTMNRTFVHTDPAVKEAGAAAEASFAALRQLATTPVGLEARVLSRLERERERATRPAVLFSLGRSRLAAALALCALALICLMLRGHPGDTAAKQARIPQPVTQAKGSSLSTAEAERKPAVAIAVGRRRGRAAQASSNAEPTTGSATPSR